jgi:hypothetical protein
MRSHESTPRNHTQLFMSLSIVAIEAKNLMAQAAIESEQSNGEGAISVHGIKGRIQKLLVAVSSIQPMGFEEIMLC